MQTFSYIPKQHPLSFFVELIWVSKADAFNFGTLTLPMLHHELIINFSEHFEVSTNTQVQVSNAEAWVSGLQTHPIRTITNGKHFTAGILFKPWGLSAFSRVRVEELQDQSVELIHAFGPDAKQLVEGVFLAESPQEIAWQVEGFLAKHLRRLDIPSYLMESISQVHTSPLSDGLVDCLSDRYGISTKTFIQNFKRYIGLTPLKYHHLVVLNQTLHHMVRNQAQKLTETGYDLHFFDQAHFIHFFKKYTGSTPSGYIRQLKAGKVDPAVPNSIEITAG